MLQRLFTKSEQLIRTKTVLTLPMLSLNTSCHVISIITIIITTIIKSVIYISYDHSYEGSCSRCLKQVLTKLPTVSKTKQHGLKSIKNGGKIM